MRAHTHTHTEKLYGGKDWVEERHRHRYEVNPEYVGYLEEKGLKFVGKSTDHQRMEILELEGRYTMCGVYTPTNTHTLSLTHTHTHTHTLSLSLSLSLSHTHTHTLSLSLSLTHTHTHTHTHSLSLSHTHTHTDHPYFVAIQFHPEYITRPMAPSPPFLGLVMAACHKLEGYLARNCQLSPRASYEYDSEEDEVTRAFCLRESRSPAPLEIDAATASLEIVN